MRLSSSPQPETDVGAVVSSLLKSKREKTKLETLLFVRDTIIGRSAQNVSLSGGLLHAHTLATLTDHDVQMLDAITKKLTAPASNAPQNQIESKPAIEAEVVESGSRKPVESPLNGKRPKPVTYCTACGKADTTSPLQNGPCGRMINGQPCQGTNSSATQENDWAECPSCNGTTWTGASCTQCDGVGYLFVRR